MNILSLIGADGGTFHKVAGTNGGEFAGACPFCGGSDRFKIWPEMDRYWCRGCDKAGDSIQYLREKRGLSFGDACKYLGHDPGPRTTGPRPTPPPWEPKDGTPPSAEWQAKARSFLDLVVSCLWSRHGDDTRRWLRDAKGLSNATIKAAELGFNPADRFEPRATWGLEPSLKADDTPHKQWIPAGLVIPLTIGGAVHRLRIRRNNPSGGARYVIVSGSSSAPMVLNPERAAAAVVVESELDGLLLNQDVGDLAGVVAMGTAQAKPDRTTHEALTAAAVILVSLDTDDAGAKASWAFWPATYPDKVKRWPCIGGKDPSEARATGLDLRSWILTGIFGTEVRFERFCIQTIDSLLIDRDALGAMEAS